MYNGDPYSSARRLRNRCTQIDTHELLKKEMAKQAPGDDSSYTIQAPAQSVGAQDPSSSQVPDPLRIAPKKDEVGIVDTYFYLDSQNKDSTSDTAHGELKFSISMLNNQNPLQNIVQMKVGSFFFPKILNPTVGGPDFFFFRKLYMYVTTLPTTQSVQALNNYFHFEFRVNEINSIAIEAEPINDTYYFSTPVQTLDTFNVRFTVPLNFRRINLPKDVIRVVAIAGTSPAQFVIQGGDDTSNLTNMSGNLGTNDVVTIYISDFNSNDTNSNVAVNNPNGIIVDGIVNATTFTVSSINFPPSMNNTSCTVTIGKNRIAIPVRFTTIQHTKTNYIQPIHN